MAYETLLGRARPATFDEIRGQDDVVKSLRNQIMKGRISHAYLFTGIRGTGKTSAARVFARAINCERPVNGNPCGECPSCRMIMGGQSNNVIEIDGAANGLVEDVRDIISVTEHRPVSGKYIVFIIDEIQMMKRGASNAFLKTLEEPPEYVVFILATTDLKNIPQTVMSRCQEYRFSRLGEDTIVSRMRELLGKDGREAEEKALRRIAALSEGSMRDALTLLDTAAAFGDGPLITYEDALRALGETDLTEYAAVTDAIAGGDAGGALRALDGIMASGCGTEEAGLWLLVYLRDVFLVKNGLGGSVQASPDQAAKIRASAERIGDEELDRYIDVVDDAMREIQYSEKKKILLETAVAQAAGPGFSERRRYLERKTEELLKRMAGAGDVSGQGD